MFDILKDGDEYDWIMGPDDSISVIAEKSHCSVNELSEVIGNYVIRREKEWEIFISERDPISKQTLESMIKED